MKIFICLFLCLALTVSISAQNTGDGKPKDPSEQGKESSELPKDFSQQKNEPPKVEPGKDISKLENELPPAMDEEKSKQISKYFEEALKNYEDILNQEKTSEVKTTEKRIENNQQILDDYQKKLSASETGLRKVKLEYVRRFLILKEAYASGKFDKKTYENELEKLARDYQIKVNALSGDSSFYKGEVKKTTDVLKELQEANRINRIFLTKEETEKLAPPPPTRQMNQLEKFIVSIRQAGCFEVKNFCASPEFK